jgi:Putative zinc-finger
MIRGRVHDPERNAAAYVGGEMSSRERRRFETHLLGCEECWREMQLDQEGRRRAEALRELAPARLRDDVRAAVSFSPAQRARSHRVAVGIAASVALIATVAFSLTLLGRGGAGEPASIAAALSSYRADRMPEDAPQRAAPDLRPAGLRLQEAGRGSLANLTADVFSYRDATGDLVYLFMTASTFPTATDAVEGAGMAGGWSAKSNGMLMVCRSRPSSYLLVGRDPALIERADRLMSTGPGTSS